MQIYKLVRIQNIPIGIEEAWHFFSRPEYLIKICPPYVDFKVISEIKNVDIHNGMNIQYRVSPLMGIPLNWISEIRDMKEPACFVDIQKRGPFKLWEHTHLFKEIPGGVEMTDSVEYALPYGLLGQAINKFLIANKLKSIFDYRVEAIKKLFGEYR
ncbi:MAG TPA: SRPBCC family protein [Saprospiraceae bacterium]|nr:SRPBCC family protein [Saprospiraceae bacterium]